MRGVSGSMFRKRRIFVHNFTQSLSIILATAKIEIRPNVDPALSLLFAFNQKGA